MRSPVPAVSRCTCHLWEGLHFPKAACWTLQSACKDWLPPKPETIVLVVIAIVLALGLLACIISHYKMGARSWSERRTQPPPPAHLQNHVPHSPQTPPPPTTPPPAPGPPGYQPHTTPTKQLKQKHILPTLPTPTLDKSALYTPSTPVERQRLEAAVLRDRQARLHSVQTDFVLELPPAIALPDGEEHPYGIKLHLRDQEQESEIYRGYIRPPPNRTILESENPQFPPPPYRSSSVGGLIHKTSQSLCNVIRTHVESIHPSPSSSSLVTRPISPQQPQPQCQHYRASYPQGSLVTGNLQHSFTSQLRSLATVGRTNAGETGDRVQAVVGRNPPSYDYSDAPPRYSDVVGQDYRSKQHSSGV